jgi:4-amino-4-deoxy-L-arabinose transferase-like glycosyltransferase
MNNNLSVNCEESFCLSKKLFIRDFLLIGLVLVTSLAYMYFFNSRPINELGGDQLVYNQLAVNVLQKKGFSQSVEPPYKPSIQRTPAYPLFLAAIYVLFGSDNYEAVRIIQIILMLCVSVLTFMMALLVFENKLIAYLSLIFCAFFGFDYVTGLGVYSYLFTEPLTIFLICGAMLFVILAYKSKRGIYYAVSGAFLALTMLTRPAYLLFPLVIILFICLRGGLIRKKIDHLILFCAAILIIVLPWSIRNYMAFDKIIPLSASLSGLALFSGAIINNPDFMPYPDADFSKNGVDLPHADLEHARKQMRKLYEAFNYGGDGGAELFVYDDELKKVGLKIINENYFVFMQRWFYRMLGHMRLGDVANILNGITKKVDVMQCAKIALKGIVLLIVILSIMHNHRNKLFMLLLLFPIYNMAIYTPFTPQIRYSLPSYPFIIIIFSAGLFAVLNTYWPSFYNHMTIIRQQDAV